MTWAISSIEERRFAVQPLWQKGLSAGQIASALGTTRSAICGFIMRERANGVSYHQPVKPMAEKKPKPKPTPVPITLPADQGAAPVFWEPIEGSIPISILDLPRRDGVACRWPVTGGYCGIACGDKMYCPTHYAVAYRPVEKFRIPKEAGL